MADSLTVPYSKTTTGTPRWENMPLLGMAPTRLMQVRSEQRKAPICLAGAPLFSARLRCVGRCSRSALQTTNPSGLIQGTKMAAISLGQGSHPTITSNTEAGQFSNSDSRFGVDQLRDNVDRVSLGRVTSRPQESSGRFVNFLLGRGGHYPR